MKKNILLVCFLFALSSCGKSIDSKSTDSKVSIDTQQTTTQDSANKNKEISASSLKEAIEQVKPILSDVSVGEKFGDGQRMFGRWAIKNLKWSEIQTLPSTTLPLTMKDSENEKGKRICVNGVIVQIEVNKTDLGKIAQGLIAQGNKGLYSFAAIGSSGNLTERSRAKFCGVVTGKHDYSNSGGGVSHSVILYGMFDLPENKK